MTLGRGKVYLVGAGVGDPVYLTRRAEERLKQAEVLIYDALVDNTVLQLLPENCLKIEVGKRGGQPSTPQSEINQLLVEYAMRGHQVVRLKGGDPFIFGRTAAEIQALIEAKCEFEVIPGISSALAAPLLAHIPLTDPVMSRCFAVMTAHEIEALNWQALVELDTLVILMGSRNLEEIVHQLIRHGRSPLTPIAIIRSGGTSNQQVWTGTLADIITKTTGVSLSPAVIVVGDVVGLRHYLTPPQTLNLTKPLTGKTILVTRSAGQSSQFTELLQHQGANVIEMPALVIGPPSSWQALDRAIATLETEKDHFDWLILTSANGVEYFFNRLLEQGKDSRALSQTKIAVVGKKTAETLAKYYLKPDFIPPDFVADSLVEHFPDPLPGKRILFPRVESGGREVLVQEFTAKGAEVIEVAAYQSGCPDAIAPDALKALQSQQVDVITFASSKTVNNFAQLLQNPSLPSRVSPTLEGICIASIGPQTSQTCISCFGRCDLEAQEYTLEGLTQAIIEFFTPS